LRTVTSTSRTSVNEFEENKVVAYYNDEKVLKEGFTSISVTHGRVASLSSADAGTVINLSEKILAFVAARMEEENARILELVRSQPISDS
jgi:hypothetical protein